MARKLSKPQLSMMKALPLTLHEDTQKQRDLITLASLIKLGYVEMVTIDSLRTRYKTTKDGRAAVGL